MFRYRGHRLISGIISLSIALIIFYFSITGKVNYNVRNYLESLTSFLTAPNKQADSFIKSLTPNLVTTPHEIAEENRNLRKSMEELKYSNQLLKNQNKSYQDLIKGFNLGAVTSNGTAFPVLSFNQLNNQLVIDTDGKQLVNNQAVYSAYGIVGLIISVSGHQARISSYLDPENEIHVINTRNNQMYVLEGYYTRLKLKYFYPDADIKENDILVTSGLDGHYQVGFGVGTVESVSFDANNNVSGAVIKPNYTIDQLNFVIIPNSSLAKNNPSEQVNK